MATCSATTITCTTSTTAWPSCCRKPLIGAVAAALARADAIRVFQSTLIYKPPVATEPTNVVPWHFDKHYWSPSTSDRMLTAFIPFHECDEEMGTITMIDGSHRWREIGIAMTR